MAFLGDISVTVSTDKEDSMELTIPLYPNISIAVPAPGGATSSSGTPG